MARSVLCVGEVSPDVRNAGEMQVHSVAAAATVRLPCSPLPRRLGVMERSLWIRVYQHLADDACSQGKITSIRVVTCASTACSRKRASEAIVCLQNALKMALAQTSRQARVSLVCPLEARRSVYITLHLVSAPICGDWLCRRKQGSAWTRCVRDVSHRPAPRTRCESARVSVYSDRYGHFQTSARARALWCPLALISRAPVSPTLTVGVRAGAHEQI
jgi:hypothetical protein